MSEMKGEETADGQYPERSGYAEFVEEHAEALEKFVTIKDDLHTEAHLRAYTELMLNSEHTGVCSCSQTLGAPTSMIPMRGLTPLHALCSAPAQRFFMLRNSEMVAKGRTANLKHEARQLFLMDAACDAANAHFMRMNQGRETFAQSQDELRVSASAGITMLFNALRMPGDPMQLNAKLAVKSQEYIGSLVKRVAKQRKEEEARKEELARRKRAEAEAAREHARAAELDAKRKRRADMVGMTLVLLMLFGAAMAMGGR